MGVLKGKTEKVEQAVIQTKKVAEKEAAELRKVAESRLGVATKALNKAQKALQAAQAAADGTGKQKNTLHNKAVGAGADAKDGSKTLTAAQKQERAAERAEKHARRMKLRVGPLSKKKLRDEAKK